MKIKNTKAYQLKDFEFYNWNLEISPQWNYEDWALHPEYYNKGKFEVWDVIKDWQLGFNTGNAIKYIARAKWKGNEIEDIDKAIQYLRKELTDLLQEKEAKK